MVGQKKVPNNVRYDLVWIFQPFFMWMRILGIEIDPRRSRNLYGYLMLFLCVWTNVDIFMVTCLKVTISYRTWNALNISTFTDSWNVRIDYANHCFFIVGIHSAFFYVSRNQWQTLWNVLIQLDSSNYAKLNYSRMRIWYIRAAPIIGVTIRHITF